MNNLYEFRFYKPNKKYFTKNELEKMVKNLAEYGFVVDYERELNPEKYKDKKLEFKEKQTRIGGVIINFTDLFGKKSFYDIMIGIDEDSGEIVRLTVYEEFMELTPDGNVSPFARQSFQLFYKAASAIAFALEPYFVWGDHEASLDEIAPYLSFSKVSALAWINMFSFEFVEKLGGLNKVLLFPPHPEVKKIYETSKKTGEYMFVPLQLTDHPGGITPQEIVKKCREKFPGVVLR